VRQLRARHRKQMTASYHEGEAKRDSFATGASLVGSAWDRADWQRLWLGTQSRPWRSLAVVASDHSVSTYHVASLIAGLGLQHGEAFRMVDVRNITLNRAAAIIELAEHFVTSGERIVFAARSITENLATVPIARSADCVLLCVSLGSSSLALVEETVAQLGKERFIGSLLIKGLAKSPRPLFDGTAGPPRLAAGS
jgi:hypothetical protein